VIKVVESSVNEFRLACEKTDFNSGKKSEGEDVNLKIHTSLKNYYFTQFVSLEFSASSRLMSNNSSTLNY
jgi:hypothetical protein